MFSADVLALAAYETVKICVPTILDGWLGRVSARKCDQRLDSWAKDAKVILGRELRHTIEKISPEAVKPVAAPPVE